MKKWTKDPNRHHKLLEPKRLSMGKWINKLRYIHAMKSLPAIIRTELFIYAAWMNLKLC